MTGSEMAVVNATALREGGALSVLRQWVEAVPSEPSDYLVFADPAVIPLLPVHPRVHYVGCSTHSMLRRLWWDAFGLRRWLKRHVIRPLLALSLQNTGFRVGARVPEFVYFHQSLVFEKAAWSWTDAQQRTLWFYAHVYPWAVRCFLHADTRVFVQLEGIKNSFAQKFGHDPDKIITVFPTVGPPMSPSDDDTPLDASVLRLFYPALPFAYKNHQVLCEALPQLGRPCRLYLTTPPVPGEGRPELVRLGQLDKAQMARLYHQCDALVFPSKVETFGLPLLEAALCGLPVIAADKPYARDVLAGYEGARFVDADDPAAWAAAIGALRCGVRYRPIDVSGRRSWDYLFEQLWKK